MTGSLRPLLIAAGLLALWEAAVWVGDIPHYILPPPSVVALEFMDRSDLLAEHAAWTLMEIIIGLVLGVILGGGAALAMARSVRLRAWGLPLMVISQAVPVFAIAPLLVLWLGYGLASKIAMATLIIFFPVASAFYDGLRRVDPGWLDLAQIMGAPPRATLMRIRLPAALPAFASGVRVAVVVAPIGAIVGEWVGASAGLGYLMMQQLARGQTALAFAALVMLCLIGVALYFLADALLRRAMPWVPHTS
ncbi:ABC transporter permease [Reyranella sp. CPCC 100927]|uniref:ABC transporter permease n=1 Tax=Reyranella sp. CPCC 100927 TaxID=2599616 RepID=UPI0011B49367|nr:ABC transporter permease [Reyranella sp. CPCC 100927]TWT11808.1 ABC transporter permease [Reyranella sp. CPCC 100927]